ncbi:C-terminal binding protein [Roseomonas populi]|uniref:C-terminal binding protein n=1 Tax=Roseomonas populi TaxID=3121582 RepID=A0ABT1X7U1_9PROT|nr:C-terminal binding protein [Roseomonas pecuniae]MCR0983806.1 C-terminal binding protein [Roseomonas pecuniae]
MIVAVLDDGYEHYEAERAILAPIGATVELRPCRGDAARVAEALRDATAAIVRESPITAEAIAGAPELRVIVRAGVGVDNIALSAAKARDIPVCNTPDYGTEEVSDHALALFMALWRRLPQSAARMAEGGWGVPRSLPQWRIRGRTLGLIGLGRIGAALLRKVRPLGFGRILIADPGLREAPEGCELTHAATIAREADAISLHAPALPVTRHIINADFLAAMKPTAIIVNTSRGTLIDEVALAAALREGQIAGAGLDVFEAEPPAMDNPLRGLSNVILTDHAAWYSEDSIADLQSMSAQEVARVLRGEAPLNRVNP